MAASVVARIRRLPVIALLILALLATLFVLERIATTEPLNAQTTASFFSPPSQDAPGAGAIRDALGRFAPQSSNTLSGLSDAQAALVKSAQQAAQAPTAAQVTSELDNISTSNANEQIFGGVRPIVCPILEGIEAQFPQSSPAIDPIQDLLGCPVASNGG